MLLRIGVSCLCRQAIEAHSLADVLRQPAFALLVEVPQVGLASGVALVSGEAIEARSLDVIPPCRTALNDEKFVD